MNAGVIEQVTGSGVFAVDEKIIGQKFERFERDGKTVLSMPDVPVFRSGTFRDSVGYQHTFDEFQMEGFVRNFDYLKSKNILPDIPVRKGHPSFGQNRMDGLIGYVKSLRTEKKTSPVDDKEYSYLIAEFEILDEDAIKNIESGLWRNRSSEVGTYTDNDENEYAPTFMGVAYVDIPAVEGLNGFQSAFNGVQFNTEDQMTVNTPSAPATGASAPAFAFSIGGNDTNDYARVQAYITELESNCATAEANFAAAETRVAALEEFKNQITATAREDFVNSLVKDGKMLATKKDAALAKVKEMTDDAFESYQEIWEDVPVANILSNHGKSDGGQEPANDAKDVANQLQLHKDIVKGLKFAGQKTEAIQNSPSYKAVIAAEPKFTL